MSKDRRLGRGLAALLGTPLDESSIVDSTAAPLQTAGQINASVPHDRSRTSDSMAIPIAAATSNSAFAAATSAVGETSPAASRSDARIGKGAGVTGAVSLASLLPEPPGGARSLELRVDEIENNPFQPRREFNEEEIASLAASLKEHQQLQPILVRKVGSRYQLISGERRLRAAIHAGLPTIRAEIRQADDRLVAELAIVENLQRKDLNPIEKAMSFKRYIDQHGCSQEDLAKRLKIDRSTIANLMRLLELPNEITTMVQSDKVSAGHARALLPLGDEQQQLAFARRIQTETWSVRETERRVAEQLAIEDGQESKGKEDDKKAGRRRSTTPQNASLEQQLRMALGTKVEISQSSRGKGKIVVHFSSSSEFERIRDLLAPSSRRSAA